MKNIAYLNGEYLPLEQAKISVMDRGFLFGDGIYEVIPVYKGKVFRLAEHMSRLEHSLEAVKITLSHRLEEWQSIITTLLETQDLTKDYSIYLQITRGACSTRDHLFPDPTKVSPNVLVACFPLKSHFVNNQNEQGVKAITMDDIRWGYCHIKSINLLANVLVRQEAVNQTAQEAILIKDGLVTEGSASNVFIVKDNGIYTPPADQKILGGITRDLVIELAENNGFKIQTIEIKEKSLFEADEVWITSSTKEIVPVTMINQQPVGDGKPGPIWQQMIKLYQSYKNTL